MATRPDIHFAVCLCARFQASPRVTHRKAVKRIFRYLKYTLEFGLYKIYFAPAVEVWNDVEVPDVNVGN